MPLQKVEQLSTVKSYTELTKKDLQKTWPDNTPYSWVTGCKIGTKVVSFFLIKPESGALTELTAKTKNPTAKAVKGTLSSTSDGRVRLTEKALGSVVSLHLNALGDASIKDVVELGSDGATPEGGVKAGTEAGTTPTPVTPSASTVQPGATKQTTARALPQTPTGVPNATGRPLPQKPPVSGIPLKPTASGPVNPPTSTAKPSVGSTPVKPPVTGPGKAPISPKASGSAPVSSKVTPAPTTPPKSAVPISPSKSPSPTSQVKTPVSPKAATTTPPPTVKPPTVQPPTVRPSGPRTKVNTKEEFKDVLEDAGQLDGPTADDFHNRLGEALGGLDDMKQHFDKILKKGFKIKFDPNAADAYASGKTIILPTKTLSGGKRDAADMIDALIFESCNVEVEEDYEELDKRFTAKRDMTLADYGKEKAGIEATKVTLRAAKMGAAMEGQGLDIAKQGKDNIAAIKAVDPAFFTDGPVDPVAKARQEKALIEKMGTTKHNKGVDPAVRPGDLKNPQWLKSAELYHYEKTKALGAVTLVGLVMKPVSAVLEAGKTAVQDWVRACALGTTNRDALPLVFCMVLETIKKKFPRANFSGLEFSSDMRKCAVANGAGASLAPLPKILQDV